MDKRASILVVDDDDNIRKTLATVLEEEGYTVDTAENGKEAVEKTNTNLFNLALIDFRLPDMEGTTLLTSMRETVPKMVKIILTGYPSLQNTIKAINDGADGYVTKPVDMDSLLSKIKEHLEKQQQSKKYSEEKVAEFIETRARELSHQTRQIR